MRKNTNTILSFIIGTRPTPVSIFFFFNDPPPTEISPLPLYDALPISRITATCRDRMAVATKFRLICRICSPNPGMTLSATASVASGVTSRGAGPVPPVVSTRRSEEHTSELQSQSNLVCRLLLVKKIIRLIQILGNIGLKDEVGNIIPDTQYSIIEAWTCLSFRHMETSSIRLLLPV